MKYIDAEKLKAEIETKRELAKNYDMSGGDASIYDEIILLIDSLQQEQPEVDLEEEFDRYCYPIETWQVQEAPFTSLYNCARHFYKLGRRLCSK